MKVTKTWRVVFYVTDSPKQGESFLTRQEVLDCFSSNKLDLEAGLKAVLDDVTEVQE